MQCVLMQEMLYQIDIYSLVILAPTTKHAHKCKERFMHAVISPRLHTKCINHRLCKKTYEQFCNSSKHVIKQHFYTAIITCNLKSSLKRSIEYIFLLHLTLCTQFRSYRLKVTDILEVTRKYTFRVN